MIEGYYEARFAGPGLTGHSMVLLERNTVFGVEAGGAFRLAGGYRHDSGTGTLDLDLRLYDPGGGWNAAAGAQGTARNIPLKVSLPSDALEKPVKIATEAGDLALSFHRIHEPPKEQRGPEHI